jgi:hypothetical protein
LSAAVGFGSRNPSSVARRENGSAVIDAVEGDDGAT